ncbi:phosphoglyceromutase [Robertkochia solimangrovi]|uniref:phosphoglyceromutase n=1 Tax=Robertkochia solimangrovi TaxID=2213046 RepID=UPI00117EDF16|nr:phosphoglyceromutase [Robertkochia solimangrovi]TRZ40973.1 phosphoglyceromutase [Robertkochia solimangrovi]
MKRLFFFSVIFISYFLANAQHQETKVILITLDGLRWQELFTGADPELIGNKEYVDDPERLKTAFWQESPEARRATLFPFIWSFVKENGEIHGNRLKGSTVDLTNKMWFSYPGYNEILTGKADDQNIHSNDKIYNPNVTVLEKVNNKDAYKGKVAAFGSWDVFPYIINDVRSGIPVNAGFRKAEGTDLTAREELLNTLEEEIPGPWGGVRLDAFTHYFALEYMKKHHPLLTYISYGETDDFAHDGEYDSYLKSAQLTDGFIKALWEYTQNDPFYRDNTVFIITTDHGRGTQPLKDWRGHGSDVKGAGQTWLIRFGKGVKATGEGENEQLYPTMIAPQVLGYFE